MSEFDKRGVTTVRPAATVVLVRNGADGRGEPEVLMVRRSRGASFMADAHVFPGGRLEDVDGGDFLRAAAREAREEAGLDLTGVELHYFARWITPPTEPRRFDARFFLARMPEGQTCRPDESGEVVDFRWASARALLDEQARGSIKLPPPTIWHLNDLARLRTVDEALAWARSRLVVAVRPKLVPHRDSIAILLPWDADYAAAPVDEGEPIDARHPVVTQPVSRYVLEDGRWVGRLAGV